MGGTMFKILSIGILFLFFSISCQEETTAPENNDPVISSITAFPVQVQLSDSFIVITEAYDIDRDSLFYDWSCTSGASIKGAPTWSPFQLSNTKNNTRIFYAPDSVSNQIDSIRVDCHVRDGKGGGISGWIYVGIKKPKYKSKYNFTFIPFTEFPDFQANDSIFYAWIGDLHAIGDFDTTKISQKLDSLFTILFEDSVPLARGWYQPNDTHCGDLTWPPGPKLVIELGKPTQRIREYPFILIDYNPFDNCENLRYRKYIFY
jgi:hypothetical protein